MSYTSGQDVSREASADLSAKYYRFMKQGTDGKITYTAANTEKALGILQDNPLSGGFGSVRIFGSSKVIAGTNFSVGDLLTSDSAGRAIPKTGTGQYVRAMAIEAAAAADAEAEVILIGPYATDAGS